MTSFIRKTRAEWASIIAQEQKEAGLLTRSEYEEELKSQQRTCCMDDPKNRGMAMMCACWKSPQYNTQALSNLSPGYGGTE